MNQAREKVISMNAKVNAMDIVKEKKMPHNLLYKFLFDPAGLMGATGTVLLTITSILEDIPAVYPSVAGVALVAVSVWQKFNVTRIQNEKARREALTHLEKQRILKLFEAGEMDQEKASFLLDHLDEE